MLNHKDTLKTMIHYPVVRRKTEGVNYHNGRPLTDQAFQLVANQGWGNGPVKTITRQGNFVATSTTMPHEQFTALPTYEADLASAINRKQFPVGNDDVFRRVVHLSPKCKAKPDQKDVVRVYTHQMEVMFAV